MRRLLTAVLAMLAVVAVACSADPPAVTDAPAPKVQSHHPRKTPEAVETDKASSYLVYVRKQSLRGFDLESGADIELRTVPGPDVVLSPDGQRIAVVTDLDPGGDPEGFSDPQISVAAIGGGEATVLGPGRSPRWSTDGARIAAINDDGIVSYDVATSEATPMLEGTDWTLFGWSDDAVVAIGPQGPTLVTQGRKSTTVPMRPSAFWGISPQDWVILSVDSGTERIFDPREDHDLLLDIEGTLADGSFAPDGSTIAAVVIGEKTGLALIDVDTGAIRYLSEGTGAQGNVVWAADPETFAFVRVNPDDKLELQAVVCETTGACEPAFSWDRGVVLLGFS